ncbi:MAG: ATP-NAD kinase family protein, partial [Desulfurococcales archaeon]|nr:ATP-NAD kinase family protein [Desulfurococcales archaeon]
PIAGVGGRLGFKGSDGAYGIRAVMEGVELVSPTRARRFAQALRKEAERAGVEVEVLAPPGLMGVESLGSLGLRVVTEPCVPPKIWPTTAHDTIRCARALARKVELLAFVGGDGTARDIYTAIGSSLPVVGVPAGVKMYSAVFAVNPEAAASVVMAALQGRAVLEERPVIDVDEDEFRRGRLVLRTYGYLLVPVVEGVVVEASKSPSRGEGLEEIAEFFVREIVEECTLYILGPGSTIARIAERMGVKKTLLGVDAVHNGRLVGVDLDEKGILELIQRYRRAKVVVTPIGGQGFILGRGNQQISPQVVKNVGKDNLIVVATQDKLKGLKTLRVDTGDEEVDKMLRGYIRVLVGYGKWRVVKVE